MADEKKSSKKKKKENGDGGDAIPEVVEEAAAPPAPAAEPAPPPAEAPAKTQSKRKSGRDSKKAMKATSNIFDCFEKAEVEEFKAGFQFMDFDKDGIISKEDLRACLNDMGRVANEKELDEMMAEATGPINFTQMLTMFFTRMSSAGEGDDDETVFNAFSCYMDKDGKCDALLFREFLVSGEAKFTEREADNALGEMDIEDGKIDLNALIKKLTGTAEDSKE